jgi:hypothetical protein
MNILHPPATLHKEIYAEESSLLGYNAAEIGNYLLIDTASFAVRPEPSSTPNILRTRLHFYHTKMEAGITQFRDHAMTQTIEEQGVPFLMEETVSSSQCPDRLWGPCSLLANE